jgi:Sensors of blue-light using FAD
MSIVRPLQSDEPIDGLSIPNLYNLVYTSRAVASVDDAEVARIIEASQKNNPRQGITGLLVYGSGIFFQWLEGPRDNVTTLMAAIRADRRHDTVVVLSETDELSERVFPDWSMELVTTEDIRDVLLDALNDTDEEKTAESLRSLLAELDSAEAEATESR